MSPGPLNKFTYYLPVHVHSTMQRHIKPIASLHTREIVLTWRVVGGGNDNISMYSCTYSVNDMPSFAGIYTRRTSRNELED